MKNEYNLLNRELILGLNYQLEKREISIQIPDEKIFTLPEKILVMGNNSLLRSTIDYFLDIMIKKGEYKGRVVHIDYENEDIVDVFGKQDFLYTLCLRGLEEGIPLEKWELITSISRVIKVNNWDKVIDSFISPNIEVLICYHPNNDSILEPNDSIRNRPPKSYIGMILGILYERYRRFKNKDSKLTIISLNPKFKGDLTLRDILLSVGKEWKLGEQFLSWLRLKNNFFDSLIDKMDIGDFDDKEKIIAFQKLNYKDNFLTVTENYYKWIISSNKAATFPFQSTEIYLEYTDILDTFHSLNTWFNAVLISFVPLAYLSGYDTTSDALLDVIIQDFFEKFLFNTIKEFVNLSEDQIRSWEKITINRLKNPFNKRSLIDMSENLIQKFRKNFLFKMIDLYEKEKKLPDYIFFILALILRFYNVIEENDGQFFGIREMHEINENEIDNEDEQKEIEEKEGNLKNIYQVKDDINILKEFANTWKNVKIDDPRSIKIFLGYILTQKNIWGMDLTLWPNLMERTGYYLEKLLKEDIGKITSELLLGIDEEK
ncbi:MAG: hypothetical protein ACTSYZ_14100 [Candidatus Helarchaeota archaeon]